MTLSTIATYIGGPGLNYRAPPPHDAKWFIACALLLTSALTACGSTPDTPEARAEMEQTNDPAEPVNRKIFAANQFVDRNALQPVARSYTANVPKPVRGALHNFASNLEQPAILVNDVLQGNLSRAWTTTQRFAVNTTVGGAGLFDVATDWHRPGHAADFGETLGVWGFGPGPTVHLPLFGPSNVRDSVGKVVGLVLDPTTYFTGGAGTVMSTASTGIGLVDGRARLLPVTDSLQKTSLDYYATLRSATAQRRAALVEQGKAGTIDGSGKDEDLSLKPRQVSASGTAQ